MVKKPNASRVDKSIQYDTQESAKHLTKVELFKGGITLQDSTAVKLSIKIVCAGNVNRRGVEGEVIQGRKLFYWRNHCGGNMNNLMLCY